MTITFTKGELTMIASTGIVRPGDASALALFALALQYDIAEAESRSAEMDEALCELLPGTQYMDRPDGGSPSVLLQVQRMVDDYRDRIAELESAATRRWKEECQSYMGESDC